MTKVKNCGNCPFYDDGSYLLNSPGGPPHCNHPNNEADHMIESTKIVPDWCPLKKGDYRRTVVTHIKLDI